jgi:hypothetical protein
VHASLYLLFASYALPCIHYRCPCIYDCLFSTARTVPEPVTKKSVDEGRWFYIDDENRERGPWSDKQMKKWCRGGFFEPSTVEPGVKVCVLLCLSFHVLLNTPRCISNANYVLERLHTHMLRLSMKGTPSTVPSPSGRDRSLCGASVWCLLRY